VSFEVSDRLYGIFGEHFSREFFGTGFPTTEGGNGATHFDERKDSLAGRKKKTN
jgi:hypothetical protein